jgi:ATP-dependent DNA ligase I
MKYIDIVETYIRIEQTTKRLEMIDHLVALLAKTPQELLGRVLYLTQGKLYPDFLGIELGMADKLLIKAISFGTGIKESEVQDAMLDLGDLGTVAEQMVANKKQMALFTEPLDVERTYSNFDKIAKATGGGSQELKQKLVAELLHDASPPEAKYIVRTLASKLRLGIADMTILDALAYYFTPTYTERLDSSDEKTKKLIKDLETQSANSDSVTDAKKLLELIESSRDRTTSSLYEAISTTEKFNKSLKRKADLKDAYERSAKVFAELKSLKDDVETSRVRIENAYNLCSDLGEVVSVLQTEGIPGLDKIKLEPGTPIRAMLAERLSSLPDILEKLNGRCAFEYKYDGLRIQAHIGDDVQLFSRRLENITEQFPDVQRHLKVAFRGKNAVVEGECVPVDINTGELLPFQQVSHRRGRKYDLTKAVDEFPVVLYLFDVLSFDDTTYTMESFPVRREKLTEMFNETDSVKFSDIIITDSAEKAEEFFQQSLSSGCEGLIAKSIAPDSGYRAGSRGWQWIKYKLDYKVEMTDSVDLVVIGAFAGRGRRAGMYGALLMAAYNKTDDMFETVCKVGTGFSDEQLAALPEKLKDFKIDKPHPRVKSEMKADYWFSPNLVMEVLGAEITHSPIHTCAYGLLREGSGLAVRFPRFMGNYRTDKRAEDATTSDEFINMYKQQQKIIKN